MKLSVPSSWDPKLIEGAIGINKDCTSVYEVFGSLRQSVAGSGHSTASIGGQCSTREDVEVFVQALRAQGIKFNYAWNASCLGNKEYNMVERKKLMAELEWIAEISDSVTVTIPYLVELLKDRFRVEVVVSVIAGIDSVRKARFYEELGADRLILDISVNRNFGLLAAIREAVHCDLELMVNDGCLLHCPYRYYHYNAGSHASQEGDIFYMDYPVLKCTMHRLRDPIEFIRMPWIRPEDLKEYTAYADVFKIAGREKPTNWILNCVRAYSEGRYDGNLLDLITLVSPASHEFGKTMLSDAPSIIVDNTGLDGFLERFKKMPCTSCETCRYCSDVAERVVKADIEALATYVQGMDKFLSFVLRFDKPQYRGAYDVVRSVYNGYVKRDWRWQVAKASSRFFRRWIQGD